MLFRLGIGSYTHIRKSYLTGPGINDCQCHRNNHAFCTLACIHIHRQRRYNMHLNFILSSIWLSHGVSRVSFVLNDWSNTILCMQTVRWIHHWHQEKKLTFVHTMMTSSNGNIFRVTIPLCGEFTGHRWIPPTKASEAEFWCFILSAPWINGWVNNRKASDFRRHGAHYDVIVMFSNCSRFPAN